MAHQPDLFSLPGDDDWDKSVATWQRQNEIEVRGLLKQLARLPAEPKRSDDDVPLMVARVETQQAMTGQSYEEANWAKLSPQFRRVHNKLRVARGMSPIPEPKVDLYVPPALRKVDKIDEHSPEAVAAMRQFLGGSMRIPGGEGFEDRGTTRANWMDP